MYPAYMPALLTPFDRNGELDLAAHRHNLRTLAERGMEGFVIGGSNGEGPYLEPGERRALIKTARRRKTHLMAGIAAETVRLGRSHIDEVTEAGADSVLVLTPTTLARDRDDAVLAFYRALADHARLPLFLYSVPLVTGYSIPVELVARLSRHPNIAGMKDSSGDVVRLQTILDSTPSSFLLYSGSSRALTAAIAIGCHGGITGSGNYLPRLVLEIVAAAREAPAKARRLQRRLSAISIQVEAHGIPGMKAAAHAAGLRPGYPRAPLRKVSPGIQTALAKLI